MDKKELIYNAINGKEVDRYPFSFWTHLPSIDEDPVQLAQATYDFYRKYDIDIIKTMNNGLYSVADYGCKVDSSEVLRGGVSKITTTPIECINDFAKIRPMHIDKMETIQREIKSLKNLLTLTYKEKVPVVFTIFSPLTTANKLCGGKIIDYIKNGDVNLIKFALQNITDTTIELVKEVCSYGVDGIYFATQLSNYNLCSKEIYEEFGKFYDVQVLQASKGYADVIHCHGNEIMYDILKDYPVDIFNWHAFQSLPTLQQVKDSGKASMCGIVREEITDGDLNKCVDRINFSVETFKGKKHILSPGCVIRYPLNAETLLSIKNYIHSIQVK